MGCQLYVKKNPHTASITNKVTNSSAKRRPSHQIFPLYSSTVLTSPPFPGPGISISIDDRSESLRMANNRRQTRKGTEQSQRMAFFHPAMTVE